MRLSTTTGDEFRLFLTRRFVRLLWPELMKQVDASVAVLKLGANGAIRLTTARYYTPSNRSIQAKGIDPDIMVEEEIPDDIKAKMGMEKPRGEASLRGHLANPNDADKAKEAGKDAKDGEKPKDDKVSDKAKEKEEVSGSASYVAKEPEKDTQLQYALAFLHGTAKEPAAASSASSAASPSGVTTPTPPGSTDTKPSPN